MTHAYTGRCLCGAVSYTADGPPVIVAQCHCEACRKTSGTGHTVGAMFTVDAVGIQGTLGEYSYTSDTGSFVTKAFCSTCGSPISGRNTRMPGHVTLTLGSMEEALDLAVEVVIFERHKPHLDVLGDEVARFATQPDWTPNG